ncbi:unnamed protein product [Durusdinium trenchii]|uniref:Calmodulin n=1 Tax=Durusdinium trenchii TaxID=1381693 RepID=A0ABP0SUZ6_9DINO
MAAYAASRYTIPLEPSNSFEGSGPSGPSPGTSPPAGSNDMFVTIAVSPSDEQQEEEVARMEEEKGPSNSRIGQANAAREYLDKHNLVEFTQLLVQSVIKEQPERPYEFMVLLLFFGLHNQHISEQLHREAVAECREANGQSLLSLREVLLWSRRQREMEFKVFRQKFNLVDPGENGRVEFTDLTRLVGSLGVTVSEATVQELVVDSKDAYFGLGRRDGALDFDEFVNFMLKLRAREGFSVGELKQFKQVFDRFDDNNNGEVEVLELADMFRYLGRSVKLDELQVIISQVDFNGSGALEFQEFLRLMRIHREEEVSKIRQVYNKFSAEGLRPWFWRVTRSSGVGD